MPLHTVDAFTATPFSGNSAAVCLLEEGAGAEWMQRVAAELNQATTAFLVPAADGWDLRWFTAEVELPLCGHATLATVHVLLETGQARTGEPLRFATAAGPLTAVHEDGRIWLDLPVTALEPLTDAAATGAAIGVHDPVWAGASDFEHVLILDDPQAVRDLTPDFDAVRALPVERVIVTAAGGHAGIDCTSRVFVPRSGLDEDAVTGSAHAVLGPLWAQRLGRSELVGDQASARGGRVGMRTDGSDRVLIGGEAVTISTGELLV